MKVLYRYRFGSVVYDEREPSLTVAGVRVDVQPRPLAVLSVLLEHAGEVVSRKDLFARVWGDRDTAPQVLPNAINKLRIAVGVEAAALIASVPRVGYRFDGPVERTVVGRRVEGHVSLAAGDAIPKRPEFRVERRFDSSLGHEVWLARSRDGGSVRVVKFASDAEQTDGLKREVALAQLLLRQLGPRDDIVGILGWDFDDAPYRIEMEYGGERLDAWAAAEGRLAAMDRAARLALFLQVAATVADAHGVGALHGDIKPGNILVAPCGDGWRTRLTDFGNGRLLDPDRLAELGVTAFGATAALAAGGGTAPATMLYAAPEILDGSRPLHVQSDVYSLGVLLYQLVVCDFRHALQPGWERAVDDPLLVEDIAAATDRDPDERLRGVPELIGALQTHDARRAAATAASRLDRAHARRPWIAAIGFALVVGLCLSLFYFLQARQAQRSLETQVAIADRLNRFLADDLIAQANPDVTGRSDITVARAVRAAAGRIDGQFAASEPLVRLTLHRAMQGALHGIGDATAAVEEGLAVLREAERVGFPDVATEVAARLDLALDLAQMARWDDAVSQATTAQARLAAMPAAPQALFAALAFARGGVAAERQQLDEAREAYENAWTRIEHDATTPPAFREKVVYRLTDVERMTGRLQDAERHGRALEAEQLARWGSDDSRPCRTAVLVAAILNLEERQADATAKIAPAVDCLRRTLGDDSQRTLNALNVQGAIAFKSSRFDEAAATWRPLIERYASLMGAESMMVLTTRLNVASALRLAGNAREAERAYAELLPVARAKNGDAAPMVQQIRYHLAESILDQHRTDDVEALLEGLRPEDLRRAQLQDDWPARLDYEHGRVALERGDVRSARVLLSRAVDGFATSDEEKATQVRRLMASAGIAEAAR